MKKENELLDLVLRAHGGMDKWKQFNELDAHVNIGGAIWKMKGQEGVLNDVKFHAELHRQYANYYPFTDSDKKSVFENGRVAIENINGTTIEELANPRATFAGSTRETKWTPLQLIYFSSYALWNYLTLPFNFIMPGVQTQEIEPWQEGDEIWRRLEVIFAENIETHNEKQVFYYGQDGLLRRHDYWAVVIGGLPAAHYVSEHKEFSGIMMPTKRRVYGLNEDNSRRPEPIFVSIDVLDVKFQ